jgi:hypothetical protein
MGVKAYLDQVYQTETYLEQTPKEMLDLAADAPAWYTAVFAIAVFVSTFASILLLLKKRIAQFLFLIGLLAVIVQTLYVSFIDGIFETMNTFNLVMFILIPVVAFFLYFYSKNAAQKGWLH